MHTTQHCSHARPTADNAWNWLTRNEDDRVSTVCCNEQIRESYRWVA